MALLDERPDLRTFQLSDPGQPVGGAQLIDGFLLNHAAIARYHQLLDAEALVHALAPADGKSW